MPNTSGFWISPDGKETEIIEHFAEVREYPTRFGFTQKEADTWTRDDRQSVLLYLIGRGWIRVRGHRRYITFDVNELDPDSIFRVKEHLERHGAWDSDAIKIVEHKHGKTWDEEAQWILQDQALQYARNPKI